MAILIIINVVAFVDATVGPSEYTVAIHLIVNPISIVGSSIGPIVDSGPLDIVVIKLTDKLIAIWPRKFAVSMPYSILIVADVL